MVEYLTALLLIWCLARILWGPVRRLAGLGLHAMAGFACLWLLNLAGLRLPVNTVTVLAAGYLGIPGIGLIALLQLL